MTVPARRDPQGIHQEIDRMTLGVRAGSQQEPPVHALAFKRILVATDGSEGGQNALAWAAAIAKAYGSQVHLVDVVTPPSYTFTRGGGHVPPAASSPDIWDRLLIAEKAEAMRIVQQGGRVLGEEGVDATSEVAVGSAVERITGIAKEQNADLIIVGSYGENAFERFLIGSTADGVKHEAEVSVLIAKEPPGAGHILLPTDGSRASRIAVMTGISLAEAWDTDALILHVVPPLVYGDPTATRAAHEEQYRRLHEVESPSLKDRVSTEVRYGPAAKTIQQAADEGGHGLVVMGSRGLTGLQSRLAGSVSNPVSHRAQCSVLLIKEKEDEPLRGV